MGGRLFEGGYSLPFWAFREGAYSRWALTPDWAVNRINTVKHKGLCRCKNCGERPGSETDLHSPESWGE